MPLFIDAAAGGGQDPYLRAVLQAAVGSCLTDAELQSLGKGTDPIKGKDKGADKGKDPSKGKVSHKGKGAGK
eukprot:15554457-Heterocapsa_arctica.AAC.1